ncbi:MAG: hypothetical protein KJ922_07090, partial [Nanoarchaeota archaeon]|nr:hypothetical protein [Nanoarchaeota archaeon]
FDSKFKVPQPGKARIPRGYPKPRVAAPKSNKVSGKFVYHWWLFDNENEFNFARAHFLAPNQLKQGKRIGNMGSCSTGEEFKARSPAIKEVGKILALGAADVNDTNKWVWTGTKIKGRSGNVSELKKNMDLKKRILGKIKEDFDKVNKLQYKYATSDPVVLELALSLADLMSIYSNEIIIVRNLSNKNYKSHFTRAYESVSNVFEFVKGVATALKKKNSVSMIGSLENKYGIDKQNFEHRVRYMLQRCGEEISALTSL